MTIQTLMKFGNLGKAPWDTTPIERYHSDNGGGHGYQGNSKGKGGSGAALSALTLLAFLFLLNVMQQSLQDNNSTIIPTATTLLLRDSELPVVLDNGEEKNVNVKDNFVPIGNTYNPRITANDYKQREN